MAHGLLLNPYLRNQNFLLMSAVLPVVTLTVVTAIMTNAWLSLGLVGALSIVRYRTPVKSGYELSLIFSLIAIDLR